MDLQAVHVRRLETEFHTSVWVLFAVIQYKCKYSKIPKSSESETLLAPSVSVKDSRLVCSNVPSLSLLLGVRVWTQLLWLIHMGPSNTFLTVSARAVVSSLV